MPVDPLQTLVGLQIFTGLYLVVAFGITIYQVFLNRRQAKVHEQMELLLQDVKAIRKLIDKTFS
ncbi:hypothetical protein LCGC14_1118870 [marine sediment metagenome]|uniref:Uncharacterized protein n=1 Tax=marine sediment metagenome TaxID=412755 RepID=A0A0F9MSJ6_9ZZZZ